jgi:hypothetical protein
VVLCTCGAHVSVPLLSQLRSHVGEAPHPVSVIERISNMVAQGKLPGRSICLDCEWRAGSTVWFAVICKCPKVEDDEEYRAAVFQWLGWIGLILHALRPPSPRVYGSELCVDVPMTLCQECLVATEKRASPRRLRNLLKKIPICGILLNDYPGATVIPNCRS